MVMNHLDLPFTTQDIPSREEIRQQNELLQLALPEIGLHSLLRLMRIGNDLQAAVASHMQEHGVSMARFAILAQLMRSGDHRLTPSALAERAGITRATVTGLIDGLEKSRWIHRQVHPNDRRSVIVELTEEGVAFLRSILPDHAEYITRMVRDIPEEDLIHLERTLTRVEKNLEALNNG